MNITFDCPSAFESACVFLRDALRSSQTEGYVIGLSGGIDSSVSATITAKAVGPDRVFGFLMPYRTSNEASVTDALTLARQLGIEHETVDISPMIDAYYPQINDSTRLRAGNKMARERMSILFDHAHKMNRLVLGTGNRTEICLGYTTLYGDSACSVNPVGQMYKTELRLLAAHLGISEAIIKKTPSADLWVGQTDEGEIGVTYDQIDRLLVRIVDKNERSRKALLADGFSPTDLERVLALINGNAFKRSLPPVASLGRGAIPAAVKLDE